MPWSSVMQLWAGGFSFQSITVNFKPLLSKSIWQATLLLLLKLVQSKWMWLLRWPRFNFVLLLTPSRRPCLLLDFCGVSNFYLLFVVRKITLSTGETTVFRLRAKQIVNLQPQMNAIYLGCQIISVCQIQCSEFNPQFWMVIALFLSLILSNTILMAFILNMALSLKVDVGLNLRILNWPIDV